MPEQEPQGSWRLVCLLSFKKDIIFWDYKQGKYRIIKRKKCHIKYVQTDTGIIDCSNELQLGSHHLIVHKLFKSNVSSYQAFLTYPNAVSDHTTAACFGIENTESNQASDKSVLVSEMLLTGL